MLSKVRPFDGTSAVGMMRRILKDDPPPLRDLAPGIPASLEAIVMRCLEKEPADRYASAAAVAADLQRTLTAITQASEAPTATMLPAPPRHPRRNVAIAAVVAALVIICFAAAWPFLPPLFRPRLPAAP